MKKYCMAMMLAACFVGSAGAAEESSDDQDFVKNNLARHQALKNLKPEALKKLQEKYGTTDISTLAFKITLEENVKFKANG